MVQRAGFVGAFIGPGLTALTRGAVPSAVLLKTFMPYSFLLLAVLTGYAIQRLSWNQRHVRLASGARLFGD